MREKTPDIIGQLMGEPIRQESNKAIKQASNKPIKEKATFNLSKSLLKDLESYWLRMRQTNKITKTDIVEEAIREFLIIAINK
jgi:hypothetical protein